MDDESGHGQICRGCLLLDGFGPFAVFAVSPYALGVLQLRAVGFWQLNETNGTIAFDSSGNGNNGLYEPGVTLDEAGVPDPPFVGIATNNLAAGFTDYAQDSNYCYQNQKLKCLVTMALGF